MTMSINSIYGIVAVLLGLSLISSVAISLYASRILKRSKDILDFVYFMVSRDDKQVALRELERAKAEYDRGYADGKVDEARRLECDRAMASAWLDNGGR